MRKLAGKPDGMHLLLEQAAEKLHVSQKNKVWSGRLLFSTRQLV
jgi:hypothetical protein